VISLQGILDHMQCGSVSFSQIRSRVLSDRDPDPDPSLMSAKLTVRENLKTYACWLGPDGPTDKKNHDNINKKTVLGTLPLQNSKNPDPYQIVGSGFVSKCSGSARLIIW
jgi:hypothetical protein